MQTKSLAARDYTLIQGRIKGGQLHIQGQGEPANRPYGVSAYADIPSELAEYIDNQEHTLDSLAGTGRKYAQMQAVAFGNVVHVQMAGEPMNRKYGASFNFECPELAQWLTVVPTPKATEIQGTVRFGQFHIQGKGAEANRPYGISVYLDVPEATLEYIKELPRTAESLTGSGRMYTPMQARVTDEGSVFITMPGNTIVVDNPDLAAWLK